MTAVALLIIKLVLKKIYKQVLEKIIVYGIVTSVKGIDTKLSPFFKITDNLK